MTAQFIVLTLENVEILGSCHRVKQKQMGCLHPESVKDIPNDFKAPPLNSALHSQGLNMCVLYLVIIVMRAVRSFILLCSHSQVTVGSAISWQ